MSNYLLKSTLADVSSFGQDQPIFWVRSSPRDLEKLSAEPGITEALSSGVIPERFQFSEELVENLSSVFVRKFRIGPQKISSDDLESNREVAGQILSCLKDGFKIIDLSRIATKYFLHLPPVVGIYRLQTYRQVVRLQAEQRRILGQNAHGVKWSGNLPSAPSEDVIGNGLHARVLSLIAPYMRGNADLFIDKDRTLIIPIIVDKDNRVVHGLPQWFDADKYGCKIVYVQLETQFTEYQAAVFIAREAVAMFRLPKSVVVQLIVELWGERLRSNTGKRDGINTAVEVANHLKLTQATAERRVAAARQRLNLGQIKSPHSLPAQVHPEAAGLANEVKETLDTVASKIAAKSDTERPLLLCDVLRAASKFLKAKYLQDKVNSGGEAA